MFKFLYSGNQAQISILPSFLSHVLTLKDEELALIFFKPLTSSMSTYSSVQTSGHVSWFAISGSETPICHPHPSTGTGNHLSKHQNQPSILVHSPRGPPPASPTKCKVNLCLLRLSLASYHTDSLREGFLHILTLGSALR